MAENARNTDPDTSHEAAAALNPERLRGIIFELLENGPLTDDELRGELDALGVRYEKSSATKRRGDLVKLGLVEDTGDRRVSGSGRRMIVWQRK